MTDTSGKFEIGKRGQSLRHNTVSKVVDREVGGSQRT